MVEHNLNYGTSPKLVVFDLDYTLWPLWVDTHVEPPFQRLPDNTVKDRCDYTVELYRDAIPILNELKKHGIKTAVASRTSATGIADDLLKIFGLNKYFAAKEIYPGSKVAHFSEFKKELNIDYCDMVFFDDEERNIRDLTKLGVTAIHTPQGISWEYLKKGLTKFSSRSPSTATAQ